MTVETSTNPSPIIYSERIDGLGSRLVALLNGLRVARVLGLPFEFHWPTHQHKHYGDDQSANIILQSTFTERHFVESRKPDFVMERYVLREEKADGHYLQTLNKEALLAAGGSRLLASNPAAVYLFEGETLEEVRAELRRLFLEEVLSERLNEYGQEHFFSQATVPVGMHIRVGDVEKNALSRLNWFDRKYYPLDFYRELLGQSEGMLVVCSSRELLQQLKEEYGILLAPISGFSDQEQAVVEMMALSTCEVLYGPRMSAFLSFAWMISPASKRHLISGMGQDDFFDHVTDFLRNERACLALEILEISYQEMLEKYLEPDSTQEIARPVNGFLKKELVAFFIRIRRHLLLSQVEKDCSPEVIERVTAFYLRVARLMLQDERHLGVFRRIRSEFVLNYLDHAMRILQKEPNPPPSLPTILENLRHARQNFKK